MVSTLTLGAVDAGLPVAAFNMSAVWPCTVTNHCAGALAFAPWGNCCRVSESPIAIVVATSDGSFMVFSVMRNAVALLVGFTRSSTRSAALPA